MHYLDVDDLTPTELDAVLELAAEIKQDDATAGDRTEETTEPLAGKTLVQLYEKPSTRTRLSFETGMTQLGGHAVFLGPDDTHLGRCEPIRDTARAISCYADAVTLRVFDHDDVETFAEYADVPVINALTDDAHPCQTLADLLTLREQFGDGVSVAWVGDGNNVCQSFALGAAMRNLDLTIATPENYGVDDAVLARADAVGDAPVTTHDPTAAVADADVVYTDVWVSMGEEDEREAKLAAFDGFQITPELLDGRAFMHCLPAHRGEEVTDDALESESSLVWQQAENRLHAQKGLLAWLAAG